MAEDQGKPDEEKLEFTAEGETFGYISLDQARVLAMEHARDNRAFYGWRYSRREMVWEELSAEDSEDYYRIQLSYRPAGNFRGRPGSEQFIIDKVGDIRLRQRLQTPSRQGPPALLLSATGLVVIGIAAVGGFFATGGLGGEEEPRALVSVPTKTPVLPTAPAGPTVLPVVAPTDRPTLTPTPAPTATPTASPTPTAIATPAPTVMPTLEPIPLAPSNDTLLPDPVPSASGAPVLPPNVFEPMSSANPAPCAREEIGPPTSQQLPRDSGGGFSSQEPGGGPEGPPGDPDGGGPGEPERGFGGGSLLPPAEITGLAIVDCSWVHEGVPISAWIDSTRVATTTAIFGEYTLVVPEPKSSEDLVTFTIGEHQVNETATWQTGRPIELDLNATLTLTAMFGANRLHTGVYYTAGINTFGSLKWRFQAQGGISASPAFTGGAVYFGDLDGHFYAVDANTGQQLWRSRALSPIFSSPAISGEIVYFGTAEGEFLALDAATGQERWRFLTEGLLESSAAVSNGVVFFGTVDGKLYALDALTGEERWSFLAGDTIFSSPAVYFGTVFFGSQDGRLYALEQGTGRERWSFQTGRPVQSSPAITLGTVYIGNLGGRFFGVDVNRGQEKWVFQSDDFIRGVPAVLDRSVYFSSGKDLISLDTFAGEENWRFTMSESLNGASGSSPAIAEGAVYFTGTDNFFYVLDAETGEGRWKFKIEGSVASPPVIVDGVVYFGSNNGYLYALE